MNQRDRSTLLRHFEERGGVPFRYDWRSKNEAVLWIADAVSGTIHDHFTGNDSRYFERLIEHCVFIADPAYT